MEVVPRSPPQRTLIEHLLNAGRRVRDSVGSCPPGSGRPSAAERALRTGTLSEWPSRGGGRGAAGGGEGRAGSGPQGEGPGWLPRAP